MESNKNAWSHGLKGVCSCGFVTLGTLDFWPGEMTNSQEFPIFSEIEGREYQVGVVAAMNTGEALHD